MLRILLRPSKPAKLPTGQQHYRANAQVVQGIGYTVYHCSLFYYDLASFVGHGVLPHLTDAKKQCEAAIEKYRATQKPAADE